MDWAEVGGEEERPPDPEEGLWHAVIKQAKDELVYSWRYIDRVSPDMLAIGDVPLQARKGTFCVWRTLLQVSRYVDAQNFFVNPRSNFDLACWGVPQHLILSRIEGYLSSPCDLGAIVRSSHRYMSLRDGHGVEWYTQKFEVDGVQETVSVIVRHALLGGLDQC